MCLDGFGSGFHWVGMIGARSQWEVAPNTPIHACNCKLVLSLNEDFALATETVLDSDGA